jgi:hypothetical protein
MPPTEDKRKAARETIDVLYEISSLLVRQLYHDRRVGRATIASSQLRFLRSAAPDSPTNHCRTRI